MDSLAPARSALAGHRLRRIPFVVSQTTQVQPSAQRLRGTSYPGSWFQKIIYPNGVASLQLLQRDYLQTDETPVGVQSPEVKGRNHQAWQWQYSAPGGPVVFDFQMSRGREGPQDFLKGYRGVLQTDAYGGYNSSVVEGILHAACWAHVRRKFRDALKLDPADTEAADVLQRIGRLYEIERQAREQKLDAAARLQLRQQQSVAEVSALKERMQAIRQAVLPGSQLAKACDYALSLLGSFCLGYASLHGGGGGDLSFAALAKQGAALSHPWLVAAWVLLLAGYGTKMGLAPMHTWKPDAYGEAPSLVGALLAGGMTTMAFVAILRVKQVVDAAGGGAMTERTLLAFGLFSMFVAALFLLGTPDFKRMLAYSSVEHMGILTVGAALGGAGIWAALFHVWNNSLTKGALFLSAGNIRRAAGARTVDEVAGMAWRSPVSSRLFVVGLLAVTACPPFGPFFSELRIVRTAFETGRHWTVAAFLCCLLFAFFGMTRLVFAIVDGRPRAAARATSQRVRETAGTILPPLIFLGFSLWLGLATPAVLRETWDAAAKLLFPTP